MNPDEDDDLRLLLQPELYDAMYPHTFRGEVEFWMRQAEFGQPILELGCGTGRLLLPLLTAGFEIDGLDHSQRMLARVEERIRERRLGTRLLLGDFRTFRSDREYAQVFSTFNGLAQLTCPEELQSCTDNVARALGSGGRFVIELTNPEGVLNVLETPQPWAKFEVPDGLGPVEVVTRPRFDPHTRIMEHRLRYRWPHLREPSEQCLRLRQHTLAELELTLARSGFQVDDVWGDFEQRPWGIDAESLIVAAHVG